MKTATISRISLISAVALALALRTSMAASAGTLPNYAITNGYTLCLDAENDAANQPNNNGDKVTLWHCGPQINQHWNLLFLYAAGGIAVYEIRNMYDTNNCLDAENDGANNPANNGDKVQIWRCTGSPNQTWAYTNGHWVNQGHGLCLDAENDGAGTPIKDGDKVQLWQCNGQTQQSWNFS